MIGIILDVGIIVIIVIAAIIGLIRGFARQFTSGFRSFIALCVGIALTILISAPIRNLEFYTNLVNGAAGWFKEPFYATTVTSPESLKETLSGSSLSLLANISEPMYGAMQEVGADTLGLFFGRAIINIISSFLFWLFFYLIVKFLLLGLYQLMLKASDLPVLKTINRIFGVIWAEILTYLILIVLILTTFEMIVSTFAGDLMVTIQEAIDQSRVFKIIDSTNILGDAIRKLIFG